MATFNFPDGAFNQLKCILNLPSIAVSFVFIFVDLWRLASDKKMVIRLYWMLIFLIRNWLLVRRQQPKSKVSTVHAKVKKYRPFTQKYDPQYLKYGFVSIVSGAWWLIGRFDAFRLKARGFE